MQLTGWLGDLFQHMKWADAAVWRSVFALPQAEGDSRLRNLLYHIHLTQHAFLRIWSDLPMEFPKLEDFGNLAALSEWGNEYHKELAAFLGKNNELPLDQTIVIPWAKRLENKLGQTPKPATLAETMIQVTSHSTYHRGQVNARLRELETEPPLVDFIAWVWFGKPQADWPENTER